MDVRWDCKMVSDSDNQTFLLMNNTSYCSSFRTMSSFPRTRNPSFKAL